MKKTNLNNIGIKTVTISSKSIMNLIDDKINNTLIKSKAGDYNIPWMKSNKNMWVKPLVILQNEFINILEIRKRKHK